MSTSGSFPKRESPPVRSPSDPLPTFGSPFEEKYPSRCEHD